ncbi:MAG: hypothetical protein JWM91_1242 [Rhodospirillales bacterium]|nr:hypothetical protein [Rhodospirillales bacterium]
MFATSCTIRQSGCRSSVVEHSLGKGEVDSSILSGSTSFLEIRQRLARNSRLFTPSGTKGWYKMSRRGRSARVVPQRWKTQNLGSISIARSCRRRIGAESAAGQLRWAHAPRRGTVVACTQPLAVDPRQRSVVCCFQCGTTRPSSSLSDLANMPDYVIDLIGLGNEARALRHLNIRW